MALTDKLSAIGDAIREKTGKTDLMTLDAMPAEIASITTGGGGGEDEPIVLTGSGQYRFAYNGWNWFIEKYKDKITTENLTSGSGMFYSSDGLEEIPFDLNFKSGENVTMYNAFSDCKNLKIVPTINNLKPMSHESMFVNCYRLREFPEDYGEDWDWSYYTGSTSASRGAANELFYNCWSLRRFPMGLLKYQNPLTKYNDCVFYRLAYNCHTLDEIIDLPITYTATWTSNAFYYFISYAYRLKNLTFAMNDDGSPVVVKWKSQIIDFSNGTGWGSNYADSISVITNYNSGITADKQVTDDATYQALKNDADWFSIDVAYSRYNHDSAVATINSLPDASAYLATTTGTNTIKFRGDAGSATDGGAINTLTEEEIAVATAKGWTVSLV